MSKSTGSPEEIYNSRNADKFVVRLPEGMRQKIAEVAKKNHRSMNSEIVRCLEVQILGPEKIGNQLEMALTRLDDQQLESLKAFLDTIH